MTGIPAHSADEFGVPCCPCGEVMRLDEATMTWACPETLDRHRWGRPTRGHTHYLATEDVGRRSLLQEA